MSLLLRLSELPPLLGPKGDDYHGQVPTRALRFLPEAAPLLLRANKDLGGMVFTDIFRGADASLHAVQTKPGTLPPGYSPHGFGLAFDLDVHATLMRLNMRYPELVDQLAERGFFCHRRDLDSTASESWHFNYLGPNAARYIQLAYPVTDHKTWKRPVESYIQELYGADLMLDELQDVQRELAVLGFYSGALDAIWGPLTLTAIKSFQRAWGLKEDGMPGIVTQRTLAYVSANIKIVTEGS